MKIFRTIENIKSTLDALYNMIVDNIRESKMPKPWTETLVDINRHQIGSINLQDVSDAETLLGDERKMYLQNAELLWNNPVFQNETKFIIRSQLEFIGMQSSDFENSLVGRGTINGCSLLRERAEKLHIEYKDQTKIPEEFDKFEVSA